MSTNTEVTYSSAEVFAEDPKTVFTTTPVSVGKQLKESLVEGYKKEYSIVGDGLYASVSAEEAPTWLTGLIDSVVSTSIAGNMNDYALLVQDVRNAIDSIDVAKNTFVTQIGITPIVDGIVTSRLDTLNATYENTYATKTELATTVATTSSALAQDISNLEVSLNDTINTEISNVQTALATQTGTLASDISALEAVFTDPESGVAATADAVSSLNTYVGLDPNGTPDGTGLISSVQSLSDFTVNLNNAVFGVDDGAGGFTLADSTLKLENEAYADAVESKFAYNSTVKLADGNYYSAGFGLTTVGTSGTGTEQDPYNSEFWVNAEKFRFTNSSQTLNEAPFTIDATGVRMTGTFSNGKNNYYDTASGWWLGIDSGTVKMNLGNGSRYLKWNGVDTMSIKGDVTAETLSLSGGNVSPSVSGLYGDKDRLGYWSTSQGWQNYIGADGSFRVGNDTDNMTFSSTEGLKVSGKLEAGVFVGKTPVVQSIANSTTANFSMLVQNFTDYGPGITLPSQYLFTVYLPASTISGNKIATREGRYLKLNGTIVLQSSGYEIQHSIDGGPWTYTPLTTRPIQLPNSTLAFPWSAAVNLYDVGGILENLPEAQTIAFRVNAYYFGDEPLVRGVFLTAEYNNL